MKRAFIGGIGLLAATIGPAAACEWHEMAGYGYGAPQRYSPFARPPQDELPTQPDAAQSRVDARNAPETAPAVPERLPEEQATRRQGQGEEGRQREQVAAARP